MLLLLTLLFVVCASANPPYYRIYLQGMKRVEDQRIRTEAINSYVQFIEENIFMMANQGFKQYTTEPFVGCEEYIKQNAGIDMAFCQYILNGIIQKITEHFPDSLIIHEETGGYTLKWD